MIFKTMIKQRIITNTGICHNRKPFDGSTLSEQVESGHWGLDLKMPFGLQRISI